MRPSLHPSATNPTLLNHSSAQQSTNRARQYAHLHASLARLNAHLADTQNLVRMTSVQAEYVRGLGGWMGGLFMASSKILGEESVSATTSAQEARLAAARARRDGDGDGDGAGAGQNTENAAERHTEEEGEQEAGEGAGE